MLMAIPEQVLFYGYLGLFGVYLMIMEWPYADELE